MKKVMLICDCCKLPVPAVKSVDLCQKHLDAIGPNRRQPRSVDKPKYKAPRAKMLSKPDYEKICTTIKKLADTRPLFTGADVCEAENIKPAVAHKAIHMMLRAGTITSTGANRSRKLSKAS